MLITSVSIFFFPILISLFSSLFIVVEKLQLCGTVYYLPCSNVHPFLFLYWFFRISIFFWTFSRTFLEFMESSPSFLHYKFYFKVGEFSTNLYFPPSEHFLDFDFLFCRWSSNISQMAAALLALRLAPRFAFAQQQPLLLQRSARSVFLFFFFLYCSPSPFPSYYF